MPYFIRQPYAAPPLPAAASDTPDILALAADVLAQETGNAGPGQFRFRTSLAPGKAGTMVLEFGVESGTPPLSVALAFGDLTGPRGRIAASCLHADPAAFTVAPGRPIEVTVTINAPADAAPGPYRGQVTATGDEAFTAPIEANIAP